MGDQKGRKMENAKKAQSLQHTEEKFEPKFRVGPETNKPIPTAVFHGFKQSCYDPKVVENVNEIREGTGGIAECIEIGDGV